jgi:hypothetical protein
MTYTEFLTNSPLLVVVALFCVGVVTYSAYIHFSKKRQGLAALVGLCAILVTVLYTTSFKYARISRTTETIVVMPNYNNLRLGEDGQLSFCINGYARTWESTSGGIMSTKAKIYFGRPMKCLSVEQSIEFLRKNGATEKELQAMRNAYDEE